MNAEQKNKLIKAVYHLTSADDYSPRTAVRDLDEAILLIMDIKHELIMEIKHELANMV